jgi:hypothetical protein
VAIKSSVLVLEAREKASLISKPRAGCTCTSWTQSRASQPSGLSNLYLKRLDAMRLVDASQRQAYMMLVMQEWLNLVLDVVVMFMAVLLTTVAVRVRWSFGDISQGVRALT